MKKLIVIGFLGLFVFSAFGAPRADAFIYAPCCLSATAISQTEINLSWVAVSADPAATGYTLERESPIGGGFAQVFSNSNITSYKDTSLSPGVTYNYRVSAVNADGTGPASTAVAATTQSAAARILPGRPSDLKAIASSASAITISWTAAADTVSITGYRIEREAPYGSGFVTLITNTSSSATSYVDSNLSPGVTYNYRITAINQYGMGLPSIPADTTTPTKPDVPKNLRVSQGDGKLFATWEKPLFLGGGLTGYMITALETTSTIYTSSTELSATIEGLSNGTFYTVSVKAYNPAGEGPAALASPMAPVKSAPAVIVSPTTTPAGTLPSTPVFAPSSYKFFTPLYRGVRNNAVMELQKILIAKNFLVSEPTGYFGVLTEAAVRKYQKANGIEQTGTVGPITRVALNAGK